MLLRPFLQAQRPNIEAAINLVSSIAVRLKCEELLLSGLFFARCIYANLSILAIYRFEHSLFLFERYYPRQLEDQAIEPEAFSKRENTLPCREILELFILAATCIILSRRYHTWIGLCSLLMRLYTNCTAENSASHRDLLRLKGQCIILRQMRGY